MGEHSFTIKGWLGTGTPDLKLYWKAAVTGEQSSGGTGRVKLKITRNVDLHSSRLSMMAQLNKQNGSLSWGFLEATMISDMPAMDWKGNARTITVFFELAVAEYVYWGNNEETITFIANRKSAGISIPLPP